MTITYTFSVEYDETVADVASHGIRKLKHELAPEFFKPDGSITDQIGLNLTMRDSDDKVLGALIGSTFFGGLHIHWLWVDENHRKQGHGRKMINQAIEIAKERHCTFAWFDTWSVLGSYKMFEKLGAYIIMQMDDYPPGSSLIRYRLDFD